MRDFQDIPVPGNAELLAGTAPHPPRRSMFRHPADVWLVEASLLYLIAVSLVPSGWIIALGIWWVLNTVSHNFIHQPFFRSKELNRCFAFYLTAITGIPQQLWRDRHLAHHAERSWRFRLSRELLQQAVLVAVLWCAALILNPTFAAQTLLPGFIGAMTLCWLQGHYEHARGTTSHYGWLYNFLFFNDGFHVEHHRTPKVHWSELRPMETAEASRWPAVLRWVEWFSLSGLERFAGRSSWLRQWVLFAHERALRKVWGFSPAPRRIAVVGGGLFPRTALVVRRLWPRAELVIYEMNPSHLTEARPWLSGDESLIEQRITSPRDCEADLVIVPLALDQAKAPFYAPPAGRRVLIHDWLWRRRTRRTAIISLFFLKRMNLVEG